MRRLDLVLVVRYRRSVTYGQHVLLAALEEHQTGTRFEVRFATSAAETVAAVRAALLDASCVAVLWSFYSPDFVAFAEELSAIRRQATGAIHVAGGVHATAEPVQTLDAGWDVAAVGEGESVILRLVDALGSEAGLASVPGLVYRVGGATRTTPRPQRVALDSYRAFSLRWRKFNPIEITRGCIYACRFCQTPFMFSARFRHRSVDNIRWHVRRMRELGLRDVRFITPTSLSYGSDAEQPNLDAVAALLGACRDEIGPRGRVFFGSFPSEIRPEHVSVEALRLVRRYCANDNIIVGAQSGSERVLDAAKRGHGVEEIRRAVRVGVAEGFRVNVDMIFGMPGEDDADRAASMALATELADLGARIHAHTFMPLPGTPWRDAPAGRIPPELARSIDDLSRRGSLYGHWQRQADHAAQLAANATSYPRPGRSRTLLNLMPAPGSDQEVTLGRNGTSTGVGGCP